MSIEPMAIAIAAKALDGLLMRMGAITQNLANAGTPRYQAVSVDFEATLRSAAARSPDAVDAAHFDFRAGHAYAQGEDRRLDLMIADAAQTAMRYSALVDMLGRRLALRSAAVGAQG